MSNVKVTSRIWLRPVTVVIRSITGKFDEKVLRNDKVLPLFSFSDRRLTNGSLCIFFFKEQHKNWSQVCWMCRLIAHAMKPVYTGGASCSNPLFGQQYLILINWNLSCNNPMTAPKNEPAFWKWSEVLVSNRWFRHCTLLNKVRMNIQFGRNKTLCCLVLKLKLEKKCEI